MKSYSQIFVGLAVLLIGQGGWTHGGEDHSKEIDKKKDELAPGNEKDMNGLYRSINTHYLKQVEPIFKKKCLDCHGEGNKKPWYYALPGARQLMDSDITEAREHMDMSNGFPFGGHGTPSEDLEELGNVLKDNTMPPFQYKLIHWSSSMTKKEKEVVEKWIKESLIIINQGS